MLSSSVKKHFISNITNTDKFKNPMRNHFDKLGSKFIEREILVHRF